jgi:hypothetical protein
MKITDQSLIKNIFNLPLKTSSWGKEALPFKRFLNWIINLDPRLSICFLLFSYLVLGITVLGFNRTPIQILTTSFSACLLEMALFYFFK